MATIRLIRKLKSLKMPEQGNVNYYIEEDEDNYRVVRSDVDVYKFTLEKTKVTLTDPIEENIDLKFQENGVMFTDHVTKVQFGDTLTSEQKLEYEAELDGLLRSTLPSVEEVIMFDHNLRSEWTKASRNSPAYHVHTDFTYDAAVNRAKTLLGEDRAQEWFKDNGHVAIINVWRPTIKPVERSPLGFIDINSYGSKDVKKVRLEYGSRVGIMQGLMKNTDHKWYWLRNMRPDQAWIFCQFDSRSRICVPHSAIDLVDTPTSARSRTSIETRCLVRFSD